MPSGPLLCATSGPSSLTCGLVEEGCIAWPAEPGERRAVARDVLMDRARTVAGQDFDGVGGRAVELGPVDLVGAEQKVDSPFVKPGGLEFRSAVIDRDLVVGDRPAERLRQRLGHLEPCQPSRAAEDMTTLALAWVAE